MSSSGPGSRRPPATYIEARDELQQLKARMEKMERQWAQAVLVEADDNTLRRSDGISAGAALALPSRAATLASSARVVEICASAAFFCIGCVLGASLFDRLSLVGGLAAAWWAAGAVNRDTRGGALSRAVGRDVATAAGRVLNKWEELLVLYKTGQLAFMGKAQYEKIDRRFGLEKKILEFKRLGMQRVAQLGQSNVSVRDKMVDALTVLRREFEDPNLASNVKQRGLSLWVGAKGLADGAPNFLPNLLPKIKISVEKKKKPQAGMGMLSSKGQAKKRDLQHGSARGGKGPGGGWAGLGGPLVWPKVKR